MNADPSSSPNTPPARDTAVITRQQWKWSALAGMASYLDAGSIVALGAGLALLLAPLGLLGIRIVFLHLFVAALITWAMRRGLSESARWTAAAKTAPAARHQVRALFSGPNLRALVWTATIYLFWCLAAGTAGIFNPYIIRTLNAGSQAASVGLASAGFLITMGVTFAVFMRFSDRNHATRKLLWSVGSILQIVAYGLFLVLPFNIPVIVANIVLFSVGNALAGEGFYKVFSQELFPTLLRGTAQGFTFGVARIGLGIWSFFVPVLAGAGIGWVGGLLMLFLMISGVIGYFMPDTSGKSLEQIETERIRG